MFGIKVRTFWSYFSSIVTAIVLAVLIVIGLVKMAPPVHFSETEGVKIPHPEAAWINVQGVYVLVHPKCKTDLNDCVSLTKYEDSISAAYQLGRLDYVTVAVSLIAVVMAFAGLFGFLSIREKARIDAQETAKTTVKALGPDIEAAISRDVGDEVTRKLPSLVKSEIYRIIAESGSLSVEESDSDLSDPSFDDDVDAELPKKPKKK